MPRKIIRRSPSVADTTAPEPTVPPSTPPETPSLKRRLPVVPLIVVLAVACVGYACVKYLPLSSKGATEASAAAPSADDVVKKVAKHVLVDTSVSPMLATVQDPDKLRQQNPIFYKDAQSGDRLLVWSDKAVLYSPTRDLVLAMLSVNPTEAQNTATQAALTPATKANVTVEVRNGSATPGLARKAADQLKAQGWNVVAITDAKVKPVAKTEVFMASAKATGPLASSLATSLHGSLISSLGQESPSTADILVIVGDDYQK